jgi:hypothetical protein
LFRVIWHLFYRLIVRHSAVALLAVTEVVRPDEYEIDPDTIDSFAGQHASFAKTSGLSRKLEMFRTPPGTLDASLENRRIRIVNQSRDSATCQLYNGHGPSDSRAYLTGDVHVLPGRCIKL